MKKLLSTFFLLSGLMIVCTGCEKEQNSPQSSNIMTDSRDGETYTILTIGNQTWMTENLRYNAAGSSVNPSNPSTAYGRLYTWATIMNGSGTSSSNPSGVQGLCPSGWHLPSPAEWSTLIDSIGGTANGTAMKSTTGWDNLNGINSSGFNAFPSGYYESSFSHLGEFTGFWSSMEETPSTSEAWYCTLSSTNTEVRLNYDSKIFEFSCRCVKD